MKATQTMLNAGYAAGRKALENYSTFDSSMVPDDALHTFVQEVLAAALAVSPIPALAPTPHPAPTPPPKAQS